MQKNRNLTFPDLLDINIDEYEEMIRRLPDFAKFAPDISQIKENDDLAAAKKAASSLFSKQIERIKNALSDPKTGIIALDIAESEKLSTNDNAYWGVVVALALGSNIFELAKDRANNTPYTVYAASYKKSKELASFGLETVAPETKLGFHTDGVINNTHVLMPHNIMLYNIIIEYQKPGYFYWVPFSLWSERKLYMDRIGVGKRYRIRVTPSIYEVAGEMTLFSPQEVEAPIFVSDAPLGNPLYINGNVVGAKDDPEFDLTLIDDLKSSLSENVIRFAVPQKTRRVIFADNLKGAHARDVFEGPLTGVPFTRLFMRSVDAKMIDLSR